jgi:hypothetical protein
MRKACIFALLCFGLSVSAQTAPIKVKIDANRSNLEQLLRSLNSRGTKYEMTFSLSETGYDYRIAFETGKTPKDFVVGSGGYVTGGTADYPTGVAIVYDRTDHELFRINHEAMWESGAISGTAKDIVGRIHKWRADHPN